MLNGNFPDRFLNNRIDIYGGKSHTECNVGPDKSVTCYQFHAAALLQNSLMYLQVNVKWM